MAAGATRIAILGLGLVGGSIARALHDDASGRWHLAAWTPTGAGPNHALAEGVIDVAAASVQEALQDATLVVLAAPPEDCLRLMRDLGGPLRGSLGPDAVITDVASTKGSIVALARELDLRFVGGHPMAGRESSGFEAADPALFRDRPWVVIHSPDAAATARVEDLATACGARIVRLDADEHDQVMAAISHLPLVLSAALVEAVAGPSNAPRRDWTLASTLTAGGWNSMTRLARGDVEMGTGIAVTNAPAIAARLRDLRAVIDAWIERLDEADSDAIRDHLTDARATLRDGD